MSSKLLWRLPLVLLLALGLGLGCAGSGGGEDEDEDEPEVSRQDANPADSSFMAGAIAPPEQMPALAAVRFTDLSGETYDVEAASGQVIVSFEPTLTATEAQSRLAAGGGSVLAAIPRAGYYLVSVSPGNEMSFIEQMRGDSRCQLAQLNTPLADAANQYVPSELLTGNWTVGERYYLDAAKVPDAWAFLDQQFGPWALLMSSKQISIIDGDFDALAVDGSQYVDDATSRFPGYTQDATRTRTHGLHVANLAIARHGNDRKPVGVNPISKVRLVRYSNSTADTQWNFALGYQIYSEVCGRGSEVVSLSLGAATPEGWRDKWEKLCKHYFMALKQAARTCRHCRGDSFLLVTAAGNEDGLSMNWEPSAENVLVVGAYDPFHSRIVPYSNRGLHVDLYVSGFSDGQRDGLFPAFRTDGTEELMQGTSFACPVASGLATLAWEIPRDPPLKGSEVKQLLLCSAAVDGAGNRVLDASAAVRAAASNGVSTYELTESSPATGGHTFKLEGTACPPVDNRRGWYTFQQSGSGADYYMSANWWNTAGVPYMEFLHSYNLGWYDEPDTEEDERVWNWYLRGPIVAGTHWSAIGRSNDFTIRSDSRIETIAAKVIVPAGEYEACVKVVETMTVPAGYAAVAGNYWVTKYERWLKAGVGWVQVRAHRSDGKVAQGQLLAFHSAGGGSTFFPVATGTRWKFRWETLDR